MLLLLAIMPAAGNHEDYNTASRAFVDHFNLPKVGAQDTSKGTYSSYDYGNAHLIVLNTNDNASTGVKGELSKEQIDWLKADIAASKKRCLLYSTGGIFLF